LTEKFKFAIMSGKTNFKFRPPPSTIFFRGVLLRGGFCIV